MVKSLSDDQTQLLEAWPKSEPVERLSDKEKSEIEEIELYKKKKGMEIFFRVQKLKLQQPQLYQHQNKFMARKALSEGEIMSNQTSTAISASPDMESVHELKNRL